MAEEFAPGIPAARKIEPLPTVTRPQKWEFALQRHEAERAGTHFDLRLGTGAHAHSWALRNWPGPGQKTLAVHQPTHTVAYMDYRGRIESGYGAGQVHLARREKAEVLRADRDQIRFNLYPGRETEEYLLRRTGQGWILINSTPTRERKKHLAASKPAYKLDRPKSLDPKAADEVWQAKIDGAHVLVDMERSGGPVRVYSYRRGTGPTGLIHHSPRLPGFQKMRVPPGLGGCTFRGELFARDRRGRALPAARVGGLLNSGVWKSREGQKKEGRVELVVFDISRWKGKDVSDLAYGQKIELMRQAQRLAPWIRFPKTATRAGAKARLLKSIVKGREKSTREGLVVWRLGESRPRKAKIREEKDVYVRSIFPEKGGRGLAGGFEYSQTKNGPVVGRVGTGFSHALKRDMQENPSNYIGLRAKIESDRAPGHYAHRAPAFTGWHLDQEMAEGIKMAKYGPTRRGIHDAIGVASPLLGAAGGAYLAAKSSKKFNRIEPGETEKEFEKRKKSEAWRSGLAGGYLGYRAGSHLGQIAQHKIRPKGGYEGYQFKHGPRWAWGDSGGKSEPKQTKSHWGSGIDPGVVRKAEGAARHVHSGGREGETAKKILDNLGKKHGFKPKDVLHHTKTASYIAGIEWGMINAKG